MAKESIRIVNSYNEPLDQLAQERKLEQRRFEELLQTHPELNFIRSGGAGRVRFDAIPSDIEGRKVTIVCRDLERAPIIDIVQRKFRRSFPLTLDYTLPEDTQLFGDSPKEELELFIHKEVYRKNHLGSVVSLLIRDNTATDYTGTAFCVSPIGGYLTCFHNVYDSEQLWIHRSVITTPLKRVGSHKESVTVVSCELPMLDKEMKDPADNNQTLGVDYAHHDIAFFNSSHGEHFLIPCAELTLEEPIVCIGYPGEFNSWMIRDSYRDVKPLELIPDVEEYEKLFRKGSLSVSPGRLIAWNSSALAYEVATIPGFSGAPVCLLRNPRFFVGIHYMGRKEKDYKLAVSVKDPGFYHLYSTRVVPQLRHANLTRQDVDAINRYLRIGDTPPIE